MPQVLQVEKCLHGGCHRRWHRGEPAKVIALALGRLLVAEVLFKDELHRLGTERRRAALILLHPFARLLSVRGGCPRKSGYVNARWTALCCQGPSVNQEASR